MWFPNYANFAYHLVLQPMIKFCSTIMCSKDDLVIPSGAQTNFEHTIMHYTHESRPPTYILIVLCVLLCFVNRSGHAWLASGGTSAPSTSRFGVLRSCISLLRILYRRKMQFQLTIHLTIMCMRALSQPSLKAPFNYWLIVS
jgi:hypothetical protein